VESIESGKRILDLVSDRIIRITSGSLVLAALAGYAFLLVLINGRPFGVTQLKEITGGVGILDLEVIYTPDQAYTLFSAMGEAGRAFDLTRIVPLDMLFPLTYTLFDAIAITWLLHRWLPAGSRWHRLNVVPLVAGIADYCENFGIITMLLAWPVQLADIARFTMAMGLIKFTFGILSALILFGALAGWAVSFIKSRRGGSPAL
jgi:hypothetical protein